MDKIFPPPKEFGSLRRRRALLSAVGVSADGALTYECAIRDLNAQAGKISFHGAHLPDRFYLINVKDRVAYDASVAWKRNGAAGLKWLSVISLAEATEGKFAHLRKIWMERALR